MAEEWNQEGKVTSNWMSPGLWSLVVPAPFLMLKAS